MGEQVEIEVPGCGRVGGWLARPEGPPRGALVVIQEIFGVNPHMREVADGYAGDGYLALAPAFFDPIERGLELGYDKESSRRGRELVDELGMERALAIVDASAGWLRAALAVTHEASPTEGARVGAVGFCWGGTVAYLANTRFGLPAVSYYGARTPHYLDEALRAPMMFHFGGKDDSIGPEAVALHREKHPDALAYVYPDAGHAFNRRIDPGAPMSASAHLAYEPASAHLAHKRTLQLFHDALH
ncbi:MAG: dienelactone hydrolase family protein [Luteimonas sp.]|nr:dienelactone hydrolase family protein [Luteimonas sp.]